MVLFKFALVSCFFSPIPFAAKAIAEVFSRIDHKFDLMSLCHTSGFPNEFSKDGTFFKLFDDGSGSHQTCFFSVQV